MTVEKPASIDWQEVASAASLELLIAGNSPELTASPYARLVLRGDSSVRLQSDATDLGRPLRPGDVAAVFLMEHRIAVERWLSAPAPSVAGAELDAFATVLVRALRAKATVPR